MVRRDSQYAKPEVSAEDKPAPLPRNLLTSRVVALSFPKLPLLVGRSRPIGQLSAQCGVESVTAPCASIVRSTGV